MSHLLFSHSVCNPIDCSVLGFPILHYLPECAQTHVHRVGDAIQPSYPLSFPFFSHLQSFPASGSFSNELALHNSWYSSEYSVLISFSIDWFDPLAVQGTLKSFFQHLSLKASVLQHSAFFMLQFISNTQ